MQVAQGPGRLVLRRAEMECVEPGPFHCTSSPGSANLWAAFGFRASSELPPIRVAPHLASLALDPPEWPPWGWTPGWFLRGAA